MGNFTSEPVTTKESAQSKFVTRDEQAVLRNLFSKIESSVSKEPHGGLIESFEASDKAAFRSALVQYFNLHIQTYEQFEEFIVNCTRSNANKIIETFWFVLTENAHVSTAESIQSLCQLIVELSLPVNAVDEEVKKQIVSRLADFIDTSFVSHRVDLQSLQELITPALTATLNNYLPCTSKALETYISKVGFQGLRSPSYKPFVPPVLDFPSEILRDAELLPLALHSEALQGAWKRLYSTSVDGLSFNRIAYHSLGYGGPTCILIKCADPEGTVLGLLSFDHWKESNRFYGSSKNALFVLSPKLRVYRSKSGGNNAYQWLNSKSILHPRGLGFGGSIDGFRVFIPESLEHCTAAHNCPTYESGRLVDGEHFEILTLEVWGCGGADAVAQALAAQAEERAVLDETIRRARQVDKAQFFNNEFDREFLLSGTNAHVPKHREGNA